MNIFIRKKEWETFSDTQVDAYIDEVFTHYRNSGFPYFSEDRTWRNAKFDSLMRYREPILCENVLRQTMHGLSLAWSYFPHAWEVKSNNKLSPYEAFYDDEHLKRTIKKVMLMSDNMSDNSIRKRLKILAGVQGVSNFRPTAASALYTKFAEHGTVLDMSCGWGGRLLGFVHSYASEYIGYEPSSKTFMGLERLSHDYGNIFNNIALINKGSEFIDLEPNSVDFAFTSPPYFDVEKYALEDTQSFVKYPTIYEWEHGFLTDTFNNVWKALKPNKFMAINIANIKKHNLIDMAIRVATKIGYRHVKNYMLALSSMPGKSNDEVFKYEPVLIFKKEGKINE